MKKIGVKLCLLTILYYILMSIVPNSIWANEGENVLFISSYNPNFPTFNEQIMGIRDGINNSIQLQIEYMDSKSLGSKEKEESFFNLFKYKLDSYEEFDAIIVADDEAFKFALDNREELFKGIPIVFLGVSDKTLIQKSMELDLVFGVEEQESVYEIVELITKFHENVDNIVFIEDFLGDSGIIYEDFKNCILKYNNINFERIGTTEIDFDKFEKLIRGYDENDALILLYPYNFKSGESFTYQDITKLILENSKTPIYTVLSHGIGYGSVGGKVIDHYEQGRKAGEIVQSILDGEKLQEQFILGDSANKYMFDYEVLQKFNIKNNELPVGSIIINQKIPFLEKYKEIIIPMILVIIGLVSIILALILYAINRRKYEVKLFKAKEIAEEASRTKGNFISNISHELRTPISVIMSANQLLQLKSKNSKNIGYDRYSDNFKIIQQNCYRLLRLTNNIIDVAKLDSGDMEINLKNINAVNLVESIVLSIVPYAESKNIDVVFDTTDEEIFMALDWEKIERVILNLLSNAIKFSKDRGIINVTLIKHNNKIVLKFKDNGIGIDEKNYDRVFERFTQVDDTLKRKNEGSGIGLSLVKGFIEMHNGTIAIESKLGFGTTFTIEIPIVIVEESNVILQEDNEKYTIIKTRVEFSDIYF